VRPERTSASTGRSLRREVVVDCKSSLDIHSLGLLYIESLGLKPPLKDGRRPVTSEIATIGGAALAS